MRKNRLRALAIVVGLCLILALPGIVSANGNEYVIYDPSTHTYTVLPTDVDDTENLQLAFDTAAASGIESTVQLIEGTYFISHDIFVADFVGTFKGAGMDQTLVRSRGDAPFGTVDGWAALFDFGYLYAGADANSPVDVKFSDMSLRAYGETEPYWNHGALTTQFGGLINVFTGYWVNEGKHSYVDVSFENMRFTGGEHPQYRSNSLWGIDIEYFRDSTLTVSGCIFEDHDWESIFVGGYLDSTVTIGGSPQSKNVFVKGFDNYNAYNGADFQAVAIMDVANTNIEVSYCETYDNSGVWFRQAGRFYPVPNVSPSTLLIHHNTFRQPSAYATDWAGIELWDYWNAWYGESTIKPVIQQNLIISETHIAPWGPIFGCSIDDAVIAYNIFRGEGLAAIYLTGAADWGISDVTSTRCLLIGNNLAGFDSYLADIYFGIGTSECMVIGGHDVFDENTYWFGITTNVFVGVNNMQGNSPGQAIAAAMEHKRELMDLLCY
ncbi:MAG: hypothetical protein ACFFF9_07080 [Candidatus Thorarchaeota archaeon]